jgi:hypothetical protein
MQQVKGSVLKSRIAFVEEHFGSSGVQRVMEALGAEDREALRILLPPKWYPFDLGKRLDEAIFSSLGDGTPEFFERLGAASAEHNLSGSHQGFLMPGNPHGFLARSPNVYRLYYETGHRTYEKTGATEGVLTTHEAETYSAPDCLTVIGWYRRALEMCGAREVWMEEEECRAHGGTVCRYRVGWREA